MTSRPSDAPASDEATPRSRTDVPDEIAEARRRAMRLQVITVVHVTAAAVVVAMVLGSSQAMKSAWLDDVIGLIPPIAYLIAGRFAWRPATDRFPYGFHRSQSIAFFWAALALVLLGLYIGFEALTKLLEAEHPSIGMAEVFGQRIWLGWLMIAALAFTSIPQFFLGRAKMPLAEKLNDKVLHADADMNRADYLSAAAAAVGVLGIGLGWPLADPLAALYIGIEVTRDGVHAHARLHRPPDGRGTRRSCPTAARLGVVPQLEECLRGQEWVQDARVRLREEGRVFFGEAFVVPVADTVAVDDVTGATRDLYAEDWRIQDMVITLVPDLETEDQHKGLQSSEPEYGDS